MILSIAGWTCSEVYADQRGRRWASRRAALPRKSGLIEPVHRLRDHNEINRFRFDASVLSRRYKILDSLM